MQDLDNLAERVIKLEERAKSNTTKLNEHDKKLENIHDLTLAVKEVAMETKATREDVNDMNSRLKNIEEKPGKNWENLIKLIGTRNCYSNFGLFFGKIRIIERRTSIMDISVLNEYLVVIVFGICLCVGYVIKHSLDFIPNKYIPLIMLVLGTVTNILMNLDNINGTVILAGMFSGLASTGFHQVFTKLINKEN